MEHKEDKRGRGRPRIPDELKKTTTQKYREDPEFRKEFMKKYNAPKICECGVKVKSGFNMCKHMRSQKHIMRMKILKFEELTKKLNKLNNKYI